MTDDGFIKLGDALVAAFPDATKAALSIDEAYPGSFVIYLIYKAPDGHKVVVNTPISNDVLGDEIAIQHIVDTTFPQLREEVTRQLALAKEEREYIKISIAPD